MCDTGRVQSQTSWHDQDIHIVHLHRRLDVLAGGFKFLERGQVLFVLHSLGRKGGFERVLLIGFSRTVECEFLFFSRYSSWFTYRMSVVPLDEILDRLDLALVNRLKVFL